MKTGATAELSEDKNPELKSFYTQHEQTLRELFDLLGLPQVQGYEAMHAYAQVNWLKADHWSSDAHTEIPEESSDQLYKLINDLGLIGEILPPVGSTYDEIVILGGLYDSNFRRNELVKECIDNGAVRFKNDPKITIWAGQRTPLEVESDLIQQNQKDLRSETEMAREAAEEIFGLDKPFRLSLDVGLKDKNRVPALGARLINDVQYENPTDHTIVRVMNAEAVERGFGDARHTTASCAQEWLNTSEIPQGASILVVSGNPHTMRITNEIRSIFQQAGRGDIRVVPAGVSVRENADVQLFLGEIARSLH